MLPYTDNSRNRGIGDVKLPSPGFATRVLVHLSEIKRSMQDEGDAGPLLRRFNVRQGWGQARLLTTPPRLFAALKLVRTLSTIETPAVAFIL